MEKQVEQPSIWKNILLNNPMFEQGIVMAPVVVAANTMFNAIVLGLGFFFITLFSLLFCSLIAKNISYAIRIILYMLSAATIYLPLSFGLSLLFGNAVALTGIFLPLLVVNPMIVIFSETRLLGKRRGIMMFDLFWHCIGFLFVVVLIGTLREVFGNGTLLSKPIAWMPEKFSGLMLPFGGFVMLGFLAALLQRIRLSRESKRAEGKRSQRNEANR